MNKRAMTIKTILFDAGGTLVFPSFERIVRELAADGINADAAALARADAIVRFGMDRPEIIAATTDDSRFRRYLDTLVREVGIAQLPDDTFARLSAYHRVHNLWEDVPPDVSGALEALRGRFRLGVVSNANGTVRAKLSRLKLADFFETIVDSFEEGIEKPDPRIFHVALKRMDIEARHTAYVGDLFHVDIVGAQAAGLRTFLLDPVDLHVGRSVARIRALGDLIHCND
jgi:putative hydrolase of the HAD superfamily